MVEMFDEMSLGKEESLVDSGIGDALSGSRRGGHTPMLTCTCPLYILPWYMLAVHKSAC